MPLTPLDVDNLRLRNALRGYDKGDVDQFRQEVIAAIEEYVDQIVRLKLRVRELETELAHFKQEEDVLKSSMLLAQRTSDELVSAARERAESLLAQARGEAAELRRGVADIIAQREQFEYQFHGLLTGFIRRLEQANPQLAKGIGDAYGRASAAGQPVSNPMDTPRNPQDDQDIQMDMEDLTIQPMAQIDHEPGSETVILPMAQPLPSAGYTPKLDRDIDDFTAALDDAALRPEVLAQAQRPISGTPVHEEAEDVTEAFGDRAEPATKSLTEIADEAIRDSESTGLPEAQDYP